jgi:hypothetical protein
MPGEDYLSWSVTAASNAKQITPPVVQTTVETIINRLM